LVKNERFEFKCSSEVKTDLQIAIIELTPHLRKKLGRRVFVEDVIKLFIETYRKNPLMFTGGVTSARIR